MSHYFYQIAIEAMSLLKCSKESFQQNNNIKLGYILSRSWLEQWKSHVGYESLVRNEEPRGRKYGRSLPGRVNSDLVGDKEEFH